MAGPATGREGGNNTSNRDNDLINFDVIELHKENIQSLPGGRSARQLASILSPLPSSSGKTMSGTKTKTTAADTPLTLDETKTMNDTYRQGYEDELQAIADADDPLDVYVRYVNWTLNTYTSAQATPQSQLLPLLERATKAFQSSPQYKNDSRYLRLWLHYIRLFDTTPRETFAYLARHGIGEKLGLFYEEFATWLEGAERWLQADEVYQLGIQREATPAERLLRKYNQFQQRYNARPQSADGPSSPALPTVRPALAAKTDPFASARGEEPPTTQRQQSGGSATAPTSRSGKPKMAIFSDADNAAPAPAPMGSATTNGWDTIGSMKERKKENTHEARPWVGETLKAGKKMPTAGKMEIFKDPSSRDKNESRSNKSPSSNATSKDSRQTSGAVNPRTGRSERVFVDIDAVYPPDGNTEYSFEELRAISRGWFERDWKARPQYSPKRVEPLAESMGNLAILESPAPKFAELNDVENQSQSPRQEELSIQEAGTNLSIHDVSTQSMVGMPEPERHSQSNSQVSRPKEKKLKIREVKQETQTVKTRLESPTGRKLKRKNSAVAEPTMTFHSKAATNDIYDMFNQPLRRPELATDDTHSGDDGDFTEGDLDDGYSTAGDGESTGTGRHGSEYGDDTLSQPNTQPDSVSPWSDFTASKHVPSVSVDGSFKKPSRKTAKGKTSSKSRRAMSEDITENIDSFSQNATQTSGLGGFDTQAIAAIANADFDDMDTKAIAMLAGDLGEDLDADDVDDVEEVTTCNNATASLSAPTDLQVDLEEPHKDSPAGNANQSPNKDVVLTPIDEGFDERYEVSNPTRFVPIAPVDYEPTPFRSYRDPNMMAQNKLPFMTPIVERTESSFAPSTVFNDPDYFNSKTPSRPGRDAFESPSKLMVDDLLLSSPQQPHESPVTPGKRKISHDSDEEEEDRDGSPNKRGPGLRLETDIGSDCPPTSNLSPLILKKELEKPELPTETKGRPVLQQTKIHKGPVVLDLQCNPCDDAVRQQILTTVHSPPSSCAGYYDHSEQVNRQYQTLKAYAERLAKTKVKASPRKGQSEKTPNKTSPPILRFQGTTQVYAVRRQLGEGAFAPVYLVESYNPKEIQDVDADADKENSVSGLPIQTSDRGDLEALKTEAPPGTLAWEFHVLRLVRQRLGPASRTMESIILAHECHLYRDEAYLVLSYSPQGTLLDLVNLARNESVKAGKLAEGLDESLAMFFSIELLRTLEDLHRVGILHGDLKGDNCLARLDPKVEIEDMFNSEGKDGWNAKGLKLIDFGRGIDVRMFQPQAQFIADWPSTPQDCAEIRECRPWKYQIDYHGAAGVIHSLLFGKYIETIPVTGGGLGQKKEWKLKDNLKRYWEKELWSEVFALLLNPGIVADGEEMPILNNLRNVRVKMETWLVEEGERGGRDLRGNLRKMERLIAMK